MPVKWVTAWARDSSVVLASQLTSALVTGAVAVWAARTLGTEQFGVLATILGLAQLASAFVDSGLTTLLLRDLSAAWATGDDEYGRATTGERMSAALSGTAALTLFFIAMAALTAALAAGPSLVWPAAAITGYMALLSIASVAEAAFRARREVARVAQATVIEKLTLAAGVGLALAVDGSLGAIAVGYVVAGVVRLVFVLRLVRRLSPLRIDQAAFTQFVALTRSAATFGLGAALPPAIVRVDVALIGMISASAAGLYAVGDRLLTVAFVIPATGAAALYPFLSRYADRRSVAQAASALGAAGLAVAVVAVATADWLVPLLFGEAYREAVAAVRVLFVALPLLCAASALIVVLNVHGHEKLVVRTLLPTTIAGSAAVLGGYAIGGITGAAAGFVIRYVLVMSLMTVVVARVSRQPRREANTSR